jgi:sugar-specific transcriptional regulator TrmB
MDFTNKVKKVLQEIGLTEVQADFYLFVLKSGGATVSHAAKSLGINRTNSYAILDKLKAFDLVVEENKVSGKLIHAKSYEPILEALTAKELEVSSHKNTVLTLAPLFNSFASKSNYQGPRIRTYESKHDFGYLLDDILANPDGTKEIYLFTNQATERGFFSLKSHRDFVNKRVENKVSIKVLAVNNEQGRELLLEDAKFLRETRLLPDSFDFSSEIYIYDGKITMIDVKEDIIGVVIESEDLYKIHAQLFEAFWILGQQES